MRRTSNSLNDFINTAIIYANFIFLWLYVKSFTLSSLSFCFLFFCFLFFGFFILLLDWVFASRFGFHTFWSFFSLRIINFCSAFCISWLILVLYSLAHNFRNYARSFCLPRNTLAANKRLVVSKRFFIENAGCVKPKLAQLTLNIRQLWINRHIANTVAFPFWRIRSKLLISKIVWSPCKMNQHVLSSIFFKDLSFSYKAFVLDRFNKDIHKLSGWEHFASRNMIIVFWVFSREEEISFI